MEVKMTLSRIINLLIIGFFVFFSLVYVSSVVNLVFGMRVEAATNETLTPTPKPTTSAEVDLRIAPGCLLPSWTGLCKRNATPTSKASPTVTPTPTKTQETKVTPDPQAGTVSQGGPAQPSEVIGLQAPTVQPKSGPEGMLIGLFSILPVGIWFLTRRVKYD